MSIRKEKNEIWQGDPTNVAATYGSNRPIGNASFKDGISGLPPHNSDSYPKRGRIAFGKEKLDIVP